MGMLVNGEWVEDDRSLVSDKGAFVRARSSFRHAVGDRDFPAEAGRYHLFAGPSCPWAHRTVIGRKVKKLTEIVGLSQAEPTRPQGWTFAQGIDGLEAVDGRFDLHRLYTAADPAYTGRVTVPVLWDRKAGTIVNNESSEILRMFNHAFDGIAEPSIDLYPEDRRVEIDAINAYVYEHVNNGVYRCGFATSQAPYEAAFAGLFEALDQIEKRLGETRYLVGATLTEADVRLFTTLIRFDAAYYLLFKCNLRRIADYRNLHNYLLDLYQTPGFGDTVEMDRIKHGYYVEAGRRINPYGIIPVGPELAFDAPHDRDRFSVM
jgi:putative glutathione S-transferase